MVHRLDSGVLPMRKASSVDIHVSGGEFNVSANMADCFKMNTAIATAMVDYPVGHLIDERVKAMGVKPFYKHFEHDGVRGPNHATVFSDRGGGVRAPVVFYNRCNEAAQQLKVGDFDWEVRALSVIMIKLLAAALHDRVLIAFRALFVRRQFLVGECGFSTAVEYFPRCPPQRPR